MEIWKDIKGYEGYQVSNYGRVRTHNKITRTDIHGDRHWEDRILKQKKTKFNTMRVDLWCGKAHKTLCVHRLVALAFLGEPPETDMTVNHIDGNRMNNNLENLEWLSLADNIRHGFRTGLFDNVMKPCVISDGETDYHFKSRTEAGEFLGRGNTYISCVIKRNSKNLRDKNGKKYMLKEF